MHLEVGRNFDEGHGDGQPRAREGRRGEGIWEGLGPLAVLYIIL